MVDLLTWIAFIAAFAGMILVHEFGHFIVARLCRVEVEEFGIGFPPRAMTLFHWKGTAFTLNWLPLGGFVRPKGENDPSIPGGLAAASPWVRLGVLTAGPLMNLLAGVLVYSLIFTQIGVPDYNVVTIGWVEAGSPAEQAGLQTDDIIRALNGQPVHSPEQLKALILANLDQQVQFEVERGGERLLLSATPLSSRVAQEKGAVGIGMQPLYAPASSWFATLPVSVETVYEQIRFLVSLPGQMLSGAIPAEEGRFIGIKGIFDFFQQAVSRDVESRAPLPQSSAAPQPTNFTLGLIAGLTITIGLFNLLPLPALDGGRILFVLPEMLLRRRVPPKFETYVHAIGLALLIAFMLYVNVMDFVNPLPASLP